MSNDFKWQTDDDNAWKEGGEGTQPGSTSVTLLIWLKRRSRWLGMAAVLLLIIGVVIYSLFDRQVEKVEDANTAGVLAAHALVRQAALEKDFELLAVLMADNGRNWNQMQLELLNIDLFLDRRPLNLTLITDIVSAQAAPPQVTVSPDLQTAELVEQIPYYTGPAGGQPSEIVLLEQTFHYQRRGDSWLLAPPPGSPFLDDSQTIEMEYLTIVYPPQEEEFVGGYLAQKMDELVGRICEDNTVECPPGLKIELRLQSDPSSLRLLTFNNFGLSLNDVGTGEFEFFLLSPIHLPSAIVVGRPIDEAGQEALYHGYANWLAATMVTNFTEAQLNRETLEDKLAVWGLEPPPEPLIPLPIPQPLATPPIDFPEQDILMACSNSTTLTLLRYSPRANQWSDELSDHDTIYLSVPVQQFAGSIMAPLPDDSGVLVSLNNLVDLASNNFKVVSWRGGEERLLLESDVMLQLLPDAIQQQFDPNGRNLVIFDVATGEEETVDPGVAPYAFNLQSCLDGNCDYQDYDGFPYWSPDSSWTLIVDHVLQIGLTLRNEQTGEDLYVGHGHSPYWLDEENFIYASLVVETETDPIYWPVTDISVANVEEPLTHTVLLSTEDIGAAIPVRDETGPIIIKSVVSHPARPDWLFIAASVGSFENYILSFRRDTGEISVLLELEAHSLTTPFQFLSGGQLLAFRTGGPRLEGFSTSNYLRLVPLDPETMSVDLSEITFEPLPGFSFDWSRDGRWLLIAEQNAIRLIAPGYDYDQEIYHTFDSCHEALWVNP